MHNVSLGTELHVITPNEPGIQGRVLGTLANAGVNLRAISVFAHEAEGHFRLLTSDNKKAETALRTLGYKVKVNKVVVVEISDRIGAGAEIGALLGNAVIDVEYSYGSSSGKAAALLVFKTNNNKKAYDTLR
ncbi:MAG: ACT domain-containing protein [Candidatus Aminicenantes bacterium]|nr:ACT domain-containing protein [Candidatus Aminicenantes bacterium]